MANAMLLLRRPPNPYSSKDVRTYARSDHSRIVVSILVVLCLTNTLQCVVALGRGCCACVLRPSWQQSSRTA